MFGKSGLTGLLCCAALFAAAQGASAADAGIAKGEGTMSLEAIGEADAAPFRFAPKHSFVQRSGKGAQRQTWLLLTDHDPGALKWRAARPDVDTLRTWCGAGKAAFVLVELDAEGKPELLTQCPANGTLGIAMISVINGLASVVVEIENDDGKRLKGRVMTGNGYCNDAYCEKTGDYVFDAALAN